MRREVEFKLQSLSAEMGGAQLREQELSQQLDDMNVQVGASQFVKHLGLGLGLSPTKHPSTLLHTLFSS